jgi:hypothetical protein
VNLQARIHRRPISGSLSQKVLDVRTGKAEVPECPTWLEQTSTRQPSDTFRTDVDHGGYLADRIGEALLAILGCSFMRRRDVSYIHLYKGGSSVRRSNCYNGRSKWPAGEFTYSQVIGRSGVYEQNSPLLM